MVIFRVCIVTMLLTFLYLASTVLLTNLLFHHQSNGSFIKTNNKIVGSKLLGQEFKSSFYFHNRPSAFNYKNDISGNSNFPYYSESLKLFIKEKLRTFTNFNPGTNPDLNILTESASGLDPHITYTGAISQVNRIANIKSIDRQILIGLIEKHSRPRVFGLFGEKIISVLELNIELEKLYAKTS